MRVGFTGHQNIALPERWTWIRQQIEVILKSRFDEHPVALSALAIGGDQLFVETSLGLGYRVEVVVPCRLYEKTFAPLDLSRYEALLSRAGSVTTLPFVEPSEDAFLAAGLYIVDHADVIVAVWNGKPASGRGGTGDIVTYAGKVKRPLLHIHPDAQTVLLRE